MEEVLLLKLKIQADAKNAKTINDLIKQNKQLAKVLKDAPKEGTKAYEEQREVLEAARKQYAKNRQEILKFNKELRTGEKETEAASDSMKGLSKNLKNLEKQYKSLTAQERKSAKGKELQKSIKATRQELLKAEKAIGDFRRQVGNYTRTLAGLSTGFGTVLVNIGAFKSALAGIPALFNSASTAAKAFLLTLGPISIAIAAITFALSKFQGVIDTFKSFIAGISATFDVLVERIGRSASAFSKLLSLDFQGFADDFSSAFSGIGDEIQNDFNQAQALSRALQELRDREIASRTRLAQLEVDISEARRLSQESEKKDRNEAVRQLDEAIRLTKERAELEQGIARDRATALREQVNLSNETTRAEDQSKLADAEVQLIQIEKRLNDELRGLIRRREQLASAQDKQNKNQLTGLKLLQQQQAKLTEQLKEQILAGDDYSATLTELREVIAQLLAVNEKFSELTENTTEEITAQKGSIQAYNEEIAKLNEELERTNTESEKYAELQRQILQLESQRAVAIGELATSLQELNRVQEENLATLEDTETELRIRQRAQEEIQALTGTAQEVAEQRAAIEMQLQMQLRQVRANRIQDEQEDLDQQLQAVQETLNQELQLYADNELKKQELLLTAQGKRDEIRKRQLELEKELLDISKKNFDESEKAKTKSVKEEEERRKQLRDLAVDTSIQAASKIVELFSVIQQQQTEKQEEEITKREEAAIKEAELTGKTEEEKQEIRAKFEKEREELQKQAAIERKAIAIAEATIDIAGAVIKSLNSPPPANVALAASTAALGAIQLAIIAATNFATGGLVQPVELEDGRIVNAPNIPALSNGDNLLATVKIGEAVINRNQIQRLGGDAAMAAAGVPGFARGGKVDMKEIEKVHGYASGGYIPKFSQNVIAAKAMQNGGLATPNQQNSIQGIIEQQNSILLQGIEDAVAKGAAKGSKAGLENANLKGQLDRENEREQRRSNNESV